MRELLASVYTAAIADILDARGYRNQTLPPSIRPLSNGSKVAGPAFTVRGRPAESGDYDAALRKVLRMLGEVPRRMWRSTPVSRTWRRTSGSSR